MIVTYKGVVYPHQIDHMDHMNVQWYTQKFDEATWHLFLELGISPTYVRKNNRGMAAVEQHVTFKQEVLAGDILLIKTKVLEMKQKVIRFLHIMYNAETNEEVAACEFTGVHIDRKARKSFPFPKAIFRKGCEFISSEEKNM